VLRLLDDTPWPKVLPHIAKVVAHVRAASGITGEFVDTDISIGFGPGAGPLWMLVRRSTLGLSAQVGFPHGSFPETT